MRVSPLFHAVELEARFAKWARIGYSRERFMREIGHAISAAYWYMPTVSL